MLHAGEAGLVGIVANACHHELAALLQEAQRTGNRGWQSRGGQLPLGFAEQACPHLAYHGDSIRLLLLGRLEARQDGFGKGELAGIRLDNYPDFCEAIKAFNEVLRELVPGLQLEIEEHGISKNPRGDDVQSFTILSCRKGTKIPINCESDGIRRIVSLMSLLIGVYNQWSMTVVIDEIDSGIYEYLLGEILRIMGKSARGQLVFTSHNLRALEVLPSKYICFTSTNPEKRFTKINRTGNSNLRDLYYRKIVLGSDDEQLYDPTDNYEIDLAFYNAGRIQDKTLNKQDEPLT